MDITWLVVIIVLIGSGIWTKRKNTQHIRKMRKIYLVMWGKPAVGRYQVIPGRKP